MSRSRRPIKSTGYSCRCFACDSSPRDGEPRIQERRAIVDAIGDLIGEYQEDYTFSDWAEEEEESAMRSYDESLLRDDPHLSVYYDFLDLRNEATNFVLGGDQ